MLTNACSSVLRYPDLPGTVTVTPDEVRRFLDMVNLGYLADTRYAYIKGGFLYFVLRKKGNTLTYLQKNKNAQEYNYMNTQSHSETDGDALVNWEDKK
jgi:hypothetical protein